MREPEEPPHCPNCGHLGTRSTADMPISYAVRRTSFEDTSSFRCNQCHATFVADDVADVGWVAEAAEEAFDEQRPDATDTFVDFDDNCDCVRCSNRVTHFESLD